MHTLGHRELKSRVCALGVLIYYMRFITHIQNSSIREEKLAKFNGQTVEVIIIPQDSTEYYQHKYYRGFVLPAIADALGEKDASTIHIFLKAKYLISPIYSVDEIPRKQLRRGIYIAKLEDILQMKLQMTQYITGAIICYDREETICGYIPSLALISPDAMDAYISKCESFLAEVGGSLNTNAMEARRLWNGQ